MNPFFSVFFRTALEINKCKRGFEVDLQAEWRSQMLRATCRTHRRKKLTATSLYSLLPLRGHRNNMTGTWQDTRHSAHVFEGVCSQRNCDDSTEKDFPFFFLTVSLLLLLFLQILHFMLSLRTKVRPLKFLIEGIHTHLAQCSTFSLGRDLWLEHQERWCSPSLTCSPRTPLSMFWHQRNSSNCGDFVVMTSWWNPLLLLLLTSLFAQNILPFTGGYSTFFSVDHHN